MWIKYHNVSSARIPLTVNDINRDTTPVATFTNVTSLQA